MRPSRRADAALLGALVAAWVACAALHVKELARGGFGWVGVYVSAPADAAGYPVVRAFWPGAPPDATGGLAAGDRLLRVGGAELRGVGPFGFVARAQAAAGSDRRVAVVYARDGAVRETTFALVPVAFPWRILPLTAMLVLTGALVLARRPGTRVARAFFLLAVAYGVHWTFFFGGSRAQTEAWTVVFFCASSVMLPLILRALLVFPADVAPAPARLPWWPWLFALFGPISTSWVFGVPFPPALGFRAVFAANVAFIVTVLAVLTRSFRRAGAVGRRQLKWVVLGTYVGTVPVLVADAVAAVRPALWWLHDAAVIAELCIPLSVVVAIVWSNFLDVDRLITGTAVYSLLSILLLAAVLTAVPQVARAAGAAGGVDPWTMQMALSTVVAAGLVPARRFLDPRMERVLFPERHALRAGVDDLLRALAAADGPEALLRLAGERLDALVRPQCCVIHAPLGELFAPVFERCPAGTGPAPALPVDGAVVAALRAHRTPLDVARWTAGAAAAERTALERLRAAVFLPVRRGDALAAAICLGTKRSGDVYTPTDLALLGAVADKLSGELLRFDTAVILGQERAMRDALRRYVPESVAARIGRGQAIETGERDVAVLFVDIRGYATYSERQAVGAVFSLVDRYTQAVSAVIQRCGGTVVEFLGDGLMAVFGAPDALPDHARIAVQAACEVVAAVRELDRQMAPIAVGVGVASGCAFVGNVRTSDRFVYTAVGDVVNLASRIQGLTRELGAAVAIDARTHRAAGDCGRRFECHERVRIRGRAEPVDVYALPLAAA